MTTHRASLTVGELTIAGTCTGGVATSLAVPELGVCWDIGACMASSVRSRTLLITHGHADHIGALHAWLGNRMLYRMPPATVYVPKWIVEDVRSLVETWGRLQGGPFPVDIVAASPGGDYPLRRDLTIRPFKSAHVVPTLGYTVVRHKTKLRPEWLDVPGPEIARLRQEGAEDLFDHVAEPLIAYTGDTLIDVVEREEVVRKTRTLIIECTFLDDQKPRAHVKAGGHIHIDEIADRADLFENEHIVLVHFSQLYTVAEVRDLVARRLPPALMERVHLFLGRG